MKSKRIIATILTLSIGLLFSVSASNSSDAMKYVLNTQTNANDLKLKTNMENAGETNTNLQMAFRKNYLEKRNSDYADEGYTVNMIPAEGYPEYYAGSYVNANGELVVLIDDDYASYDLFGSEKEARAKAEIIDLAQTNNIVFGEAKYSYRELINVMTEIVSFIEGEEASTSEYIISSIALNSYENTVKVYLTAIDEEALYWFRDNVSAAECITFIEQEAGQIEATASVTPGSKIQTASSVGFSAGYRATNASGALGFVTCAHTFVGDGTSTTVQNSGNEIVGTSYSSNRKFDGNLDAAFIEKLGNTTVTNTVYDAEMNAYTMNPGYTVPAMGITLYMCGEVSSAEGALKIGIILDDDTSVSYEGVFVKGLYTTGYYAEKGDSGGIVFSYGSSGCNVAGIQVARNSATIVSYVCKASNIDGFLSTWPY